MLSGLFNRKKSPRLSQDQNRQEPSFVDPVATEKDSETGTSVPRSGAHHAGLSIAGYAKQSALSTQGVWGEIQRGALPARMINGEVFVFPDNPYAEHTPPRAAASARDLDTFYNQESTHHEWLPSKPTRALVYREDGSPITDMTLLLDHLSLAKEENKEIIRLTKDSIERITNMTDSLVAMKDEVIKTKDHEISLLSREMSHKDLELKKLRQEMEDLQMLAESLIPKKSTP